MNFSFSFLPARVSQLINLACRKSRDSILLFIFICCANFLMDRGAEGGRGRRGGVEVKSSNRRNANANEKMKRKKENLFVFESQSPIPNPTIRIAIASIPLNLSLDVLTLFKMLSSLRVWLRRIRKRLQKARWRWKRRRRRRRRRLLQNATVVESFES